MTTTNSINPWNSEENQLLETENTLSKKYKELELIDKKIITTGERIKERNYEVQNQSASRKFGYGLAGIGFAAIICPLSWITGIFFSFASMFEGVNHDTSDLAKFLFVKPVKVCSSLFTKAMQSKEKWEICLEKAEKKKLELTSKRFELFQKINNLNEQMKKQMIKVIETNSDKMPKLLNRAISLGEKVKKLSAE